MNMTPAPLPLPEAFENDEWNARREALQTKVEAACRELLSFSQGAAGITLPFEGMHVTIRVTP